MYPLAILIGGPTATQKTRLAHEIQKKLPSIIINSDSMQVYREFKILTARPSIKEYSDVKIKKLHKKYGNSGFFRKLEQVDEIYSKKISRNDTQRLLRAITVKIATGKNLTYWHGKVSKKVFKKIIYITISVDRGKLYKSIDDRCLKIMKSNAVNEVSSFLKKKKKIDKPKNKYIVFNFRSEKQAGEDKEILESLRKFIDHKIITI